MGFIGKIKKIISKIDTPLWLEILFLVVILLRIPSFFEPYYYGDEMIYLTLGEGIRRGIPLYQGLHDNKPPLLYLTAALAGNLFLFKTILMAFNLGSVYMFWKLLSKFVKKDGKQALIATVLFSLLTTLPLLEGNIANAELFLILPVLAGLNIVLNKDCNNNKLLLGGFLFSLAFLYKIVAALDLFAAVVFLLISSPSKKELLKTIKKVLLILVGFFVPILLSFAWFAFKGSFIEYLTAAYLQNIGYVSSWRAQASAEPFLIRNAPLLIRFAIMIGGISILFLFRKKLSKKYIFATIWLLATLFAVTLSERPYPHYLVQSVAPASLLLSMLIAEGGVEQTLVIIPLGIVAFVPFYYKFWYYQTGAYYKRFVNLATSKIDRDQYLAEFSPLTLRNYDVAAFLNESSAKEDGVFVWSNDSPTIYALSGRLPPTKYVADYHFLDYSTKEETFATLYKNMPKFLVLTNNAPPFDELYLFAEKYYLQIKEYDTASIWLKKIAGK